LHADAVPGDGMRLKIMAMLLVDKNRNMKRRDRLSEGDELPARKAGASKRIKPV
jgi:hypothetical protein